MKEKKKKLTQKLIKKKYLKKISYYSEIFNYNFFIKILSINF